MFFVRSCARPYAATAALAAAALAAAACAGEKPAKDDAGPSTQGVSDAAPAVAAADAAPPVGGNGKPGAGVDISYAQREKTLPGEMGLVAFAFREGYDSGSMVVRATGSDGLELIPGDLRATMSMSDKADHRWDVAFRAAAAGVYYVDLFIEATDGDGAKATRSFSARVVVGDASAAPVPGAKTGIVDGEPVVILEAQETVID